MPSRMLLNVNFGRFEGWQGRDEGQASDGRESLCAGDRAGRDVSPAHGTYARSSNVPLSIQLGAFSLLSKTARQDLLVFFCQHVEDTSVLTEPQIVPPKDDAEEI